MSKKDVAMLMFMLVMLTAGTLASAIIMNLSHHNEMEKLHLINGSDKYCKGTK